MGFFSWIILGALSGWIASIIMNKNKSMGAIANIVTGVIGIRSGRPAVSIGRHQGKAIEDLKKLCLF